MKGERAKAAVALLLASVAGYVDAVGFVVLRGLFTAHMSGNSAKLGVRLGHGLLGAAVPAAAALGFFAAGIAVGTALAELATRARLRAWATPTLLAQALLLVAFIAYGVHATHAGLARDRSGAFYVLAALLAASMGVQTSSLQRVGGKVVRTTYVTGVLTSMTQELVNVLFWLRDGPERPPRGTYLRETLELGSRHESLRRAALLGGVVALYVGGATLGSRVDRAWHVLSLAVPLAAIVALALVELAAPARFGSARGGDTS